MSTNLLPYDLYALLDWCLYMEKFVVVGWNFKDAEFPVTKLVFVSEISM
jgi:hypothetical protein